MAKTATTTKNSIEAAKEGRIFITDLLLGLSLAFLTQDVKDLLPFSDSTNGKVGNLAALGLCALAVWRGIPALRNFIVRLRSGNALAWIKPVHSLVIALFVLMALASLFNLSIVRRLIVGDSSTAGGVTTGRSLPRITVQDLNSRNAFENVSIYLSDLENQKILEGKVFENCDFYGPGILLMQEGTIFGMNNFPMPPNIPEDQRRDALWWEVDSSRRYITGSYSLYKTVIRNSRLIMIGMAGSEPNRRRFYDSFP